MTLSKHNFTNFSTYSDTYINGLQKCILSFFRFLFEVKPQLIVQSSKIYFFSKSHRHIVFQTWKSMRQMLFWIKLAIKNPSIWIEFAFQSWKKSIWVIHQLFRTFSQSLLVHLEEVPVLVYLEKRIKLNHSQICRSPSRRYWFFVGSSSTVYCESTKIL